MSGPARFRARRIHALDGHPPARSMLVVDGRVVAFDADGPAPIDLDGVIVPAFADSHLHLFSLIERAVAVDCGGASSLAALIAVLAATPASPDRWIRAVGYDHARWPEARHPTRHDLDAAQPSTPVRLLHR
ncbi:MAG: amidohydrolase family protein, partial [Dehalococcoidia bacterium]|nr:amidohydrolase family protein [Dehalococcoidia bacterium]